ncbi:MAG TPA: type II toxin-antitoxin system RelE/ParE family toxin [Bacteroidales bacterium]
MAKFLLTNKAVEDTSIWDYSCNKWSERQTENYYQMLINSFNEIADRPEMGKSYTSIVDNLKGVKVGKHIVFFQHGKNHKIQIVRILHEQMDWRNRIVEK